MKFSITNQCAIVMTLAAVAQAVSLPQLHRRDANQSPLIKWQNLAEDCWVTDDETCQCQANRVVSQLRCDGTHCDDVYLGCAQMFDDLNDGNYVTVGDVVNAGLISDTFPPTYCPPNKAVVKWTCDSGDYCDGNIMGCQAFEKRFNDGRTAPVTFPDVSDSACTWTDWVNSGNAKATTCPNGQFLRGLAASGSHSNSLRMFCCPGKLEQAPSGQQQQQLNGAVVGEAVQCTAGSDGKCISKWKCMQGSTEVTTVEITWGHTSGDAAWACNSWNSQCGNAAGGCTATAIASTSSSSSSATTTTTNNSNNHIKDDNSTNGQTNPPKPTDSNTGGTTSVSANPNSGQSYSNPPTQDDCEL